MHMRPADNILRKAFGGGEAFSWSNLIRPYMYNTNLEVKIKLGGVVVRSRTSDSEVAGSSPTSTAVEYLEQVIYTHGAQANSAFHPFGVGK